MANKYKKGKYASKKAMGGDIHSSSRIISSNTPEQLNPNNLQKQVIDHLVSSGFSIEEAQQYISTPQGQAVSNMIKNNAMASNTDIMPMQMAMGGPTKPPIYTSNPNDPRLKSYQDSVVAFNNNFLFDKEMIEATPNFKSRNEKDEFVKKLNAKYPFNRVEPVREYSSADPDREILAYNPNINFGWFKNFEYKKPEQPIKYANPEIVAKQQQLIDAGFDIGKADGIWGKKSQAAWEQMQSPDSKKASTPEPKEQPKPTGISRISYSPNVSDMQIEHEDGTVETIKGRKNVEAWRRDNKELFQQYRQERSGKKLAMGGLLEEWPPEEALVKGLDKEQTKRRKDIVSAIDDVTAVEDNNESLKRLLGLTAYMENDLGSNPKAYGRTYTSSFMSLDDPAIDDLLLPRGEKGKFTASQKKSFKWLEDNFGIKSDDLKELLKSDDPRAAVAAARLVYGRSPSALPKEDSPEELFQYWLQNYNKKGVLKYMTEQEAYKKFKKGYDTFFDYKEEVEEKVEEKVVEKKENSGTTKKLAMGGNVSNVSGKVKPKQNVLKDVGLGLADATLGIGTSIATGQSFSELIGEDYSIDAIGQVANQVQSMGKEVGFATLNALLPGSGTALQMVDGFTDNLNASEGNTPQFMAYGGNMKKYNMGGDMNNNMLTEFNTGGTHEENPMGGIPQGPDALVEQGETKFNAEDFIFSDRIKINKTLAKEFGISPKFIGKSFADVSKKLIDKERPNDPIAKRGSAKELENLANAQEAFKASKMEEAQAMYGGGDSMSMPQETMMGYGGKMYFANGGLDLTKPKESINPMGNVEDIMSPLSNQLKGNLLKTGLNTNPIETSNTEDPASINKPSALSALRYAAPLTDLAAMGIMSANRQEERPLGMFDINTQATPNLVNQEQMQREIATQSAGARRAVGEAAGGSSAAFIAGQTAQGVGAGRTAGQMGLQTQQTDINELNRVQQANIGIEQMNNQSRMQVMDINDQDRGNYLAQMTNTMTNMGQNISNIGQEEMRKSMIDSMGFMYDRWANFINPQEAKRRSENAKLNQQAGN